MWQIWDCSQGFLKRKKEVRHDLALIGNRKWNAAVRLVRWTRSGLRWGNWEQVVKSPQNSDNSSRRLFFFLNLLINVDLSVIFTNAFSVMINSFLLSATEKSNFHMYQTRYFTTSLNWSLLLCFHPSSYSGVKSYIITWKWGWILGHTELEECMDFSILGWLI